MFDGNLRSQVDRVTRPVGRGLARFGISADVLTVMGVVFALIAGALIVTGHLLLGFFAVIFSGIPDLLDGPVAHAMQSTSKRGAFIDSFSDRISDFILFGSIGWYFMDKGDNGVALVSFASYGLASFISYQRAKAESLGFTAKGGLMERAERVFLVAAGLLFSFLLVYVLWLVMFASALTVVQRFVKIWNQASKQVEVERPSMHSRRRRSLGARSSVIRRERMGSRATYARLMSTHGRRSHASSRYADGVIKRLRDTYRG